MSALERYRRSVQHALETRQRVADLSALGEQTGDESVRQRALTAWRIAEAAERDVRRTPMAVIADAVRAAAARPQATLALLRPGQHLDLDRMCQVLALRREGRSIASIAKISGRDAWALSQALGQWEAGTSRVAKEAKMSGIWPSGKKRA